MQWEDFAENAGFFVKMLARRFFARADLANAPLQNATIDYLCTLIR
jgi:hypothetical protein